MYRYKYIIMKTAIIMLVLVPATYLVFGYTSQHNARMVPAESFHRPEPVVIQIEENDFPFDVNGNFSYVVMINNVVHRFEEEDVRQFLAGGTPVERGAGRMRMVTTN